MRSPELHNRRFVIYTACLWLVIVVGAALHWVFDTGPIPWMPIAVLALGMFILEQMSVNTTASLDLNNAPMLLLAGVVIASRYGTPFAAVLPAIGAFYLPSLRDNKPVTFVSNVGFFGAPMLPAISTFCLFTRAFGTSPTTTFIALAFAAVVFEVANFACYAGFQWFRDAQRFDIKELPPGYVIQVVAFSFLGGVLGWLTVEIGWAVVPLAIVPVFIGHQVMSTSVAFSHRIDGVSRMLNRVLEHKDPYTRDHVERVAHYARVMGRQLGLSEDRVTSLGYAALFHDLGKIIIPNHILNKPGRLTDEEFAVMKQHEHVTVAMLASIDMLSPIASTVSGDYSFYERATSDEPIEPFIVVVADAYDAMTSTRAYRKALPTEEAQRRLLEASGTQFHPKVVDALLASFEADPTVNMAGTDAAHHPDAPENADITSAGVGDIDISRAHHPTALAMSGEAAEAAMPAGAEPEGVS
ncbi:MAG: HD domain-containing phosphohydrolase [Acidimicrobiia bacterium]